MHESLNPAALATSISIGTALLAGFFSVWVAMRSRKGPGVNPDATVSILFGIALLLIVLNATAAALIAAGGIEYLGLLKASLLLTAAFAVAGMVFGLMRGLRNGRAIAPLRPPD
jgi:hypothetical protein